MGLPNVSIEYQNGNLGLVASADDRVIAIVFNGYAQDSPPFVVYSYADFLGKRALLLADIGAPLNVYIQNEVADFYQEAGDGRELWIKTVAPEMTTAQIFTVGAIEQLMQLSGGRINVIGVSRKLETTPGTITRTGGIDADIVAGLDEAQAKAVAMADLHMPFRVIVDGRYAAADLSTLADLKGMSYNRVAVCIGSKGGASGSNAAIGLVMGRIAGSPVNRNLGRVRSGAVGVDAGYFSNNTAVSTFAPGQLDAIHNKGYIFLRKFANKAGYYWNDDHMACPDTDDYFSLANGRTIDKVARLAYATFVEELGDEVLVDEVTGKILPTQVKTYQTKIERAITLQMKASGEISGVKAFVDPAQDIIATSMLVIDLRVTPMGTNRAIKVKLGLYNPNA
ncbi:DUF2586 family protein [Spirosoma aerolatum]|uniref:DUF2586 family protein n=1 Tax=Spirosoma aerolatum TaxID=1211326 RepID=UPI0009ABE635|nr:DUF2586 family protein [Spirosoma aerolatum]